MLQLFYTVCLFAALPLVTNAEDATPHPPKTLPAINDFKNALLSQVKKLDDDNFDTREAAEKEILALANEREDTAIEILSAAAAAIREAETQTRIKKISEKLNVAGTTDWSVEAGQIYQLPAISGGRVFVGNKDNTFFCLDAATGKIVWQYPVGGFLFKSPVVADGKVVLIRTRKDGRPDGTLIALNASDGREAWQWQDGNKSQYFTAPIIANGALYFAREKKLFRLNAVTGETVWSFDAEDNILSPPSVSESHVLFGTLDGDLICLNAETGAKQWTAELEGACYSGGVISDGRVFAAGGNSLYRLKLKTGEIVWEYKGNEAVTTAPAVKGSQVFASFGMVFRCLDADKGRALWDKDTGGHIFAQPSIVGGRVYVGALNDKLTLYCFGASSGDELWTHVTKEGGYAEPIIAGRRLWMGYHSKFYCLKTNATGPADWPMSGGNPERSGCNDVAKPK